MLEREAAWFSAVLAFPFLYLWAWINCCFATVDRNMFDNSLYCATNDRFKPVIQRESPLGLLHCLCDIYRKCEQNLSSPQFDCFTICSKLALCSHYQRGFLASPLTLPWRSEIGLQMKVGKIEPVPPPWQGGRAKLCCLGPWTHLATTRGQMSTSSVPPAAGYSRLREFMNQVWSFWCF